MTEKRIRAVSKKTVAVEITEGDYAGARATCAGDLSLGAYFAFTKGGAAAEEGGHILERFGREILLDWNIDDKDGNPLPANEEGLLAIPLELASALLKGWNEAMSGVPSPLDDESGDGLPYPEQSIPMVTLSESPKSSLMPSLSAATGSGSE